MQDVTQPSAIQLLFMELRVGLARSAIQASLLVNGGAAIATLFFLAALKTSSSPASFNADQTLLKAALGIFGAGLFLGAITFVNAYVAHGVLASGRSTVAGNVIRRLGLALIVASLAMFLLGLGLAVASI